jgi:hypothetical protein
VLAGFCDNETALHCCRQLQPLLQQLPGLRVHLLLALRRLFFETMPLWAILQGHAPLMRLLVSGAAGGGVGGGAVFGASFG